MVLRVVIIKPGKYGVSGDVERFRRGFMPNSTVPYMRSMTPASLDGVSIETYAFDEYVQTDPGLPGSHSQPQDAKRKRDSAQPQQLTAL